MAKNLLISLSKSFAVEVIRLSEALWERSKAASIISQLLRSETSIGAISMKAVMPPADRISSLNSSSP